MTLESTIFVIVYVLDITLLSTIPVPSFTIAATVVSSVPDAVVYLTLSP
jgi:hypothetical protein